MGVDFFLQPICLKMPHKSQIRLHLCFKFFFISFSETLVHIFLGTITNIRSPGFDIRSEEENTLFARVEYDFSFV